MALSANHKDCPFCSIPEAEIVIDGALALAKSDNYPVTKGHTLIIPRRHVLTLFETTNEERAALHKSAAAVKELTDIIGV